MSMLPFEYNTYECPECFDDVEVPLPVSKYVTCQSCKTNLEIHPDADWHDGSWHDLTTLSIVDPEREHMEKMLKHGLDWINDNATGTNCEHKYAEQETAPLGVRCVRCGHFVGAWE